MNNLKLTERNLEHITGGDEYCWVAPYFQIMGSNNWTLTVMNSGDIQLPTCYLQLVFDPCDEMFGVDRLEDLVRQSAKKPLPEMKQCILDGVAAWRNGPLTYLSLVLVELR